MNKRARANKYFKQLTLGDQIDVSTRVYYRALQHHPRRVALPGTLAGGILTFAILIPIALR